MKSRHKRCCISVSPGFLLVLGLFFLVDEQKLLPQLLLAAALHEGGHLAAVRLLGGRIACFHLTMFGGELRLCHPERLSYGRELCAVLAGPGVNLFCAGLLSRLQGGEGLDVAVGIHLLLGLFNLLPVRFLDGGRALYLLLSWRMEPITADRLLHGISCAALLMLLGTDLLLLLQIGPEPGLCLAGLWCLICWSAETGIVKMEDSG